MSQRRAIIIGAGPAGLTAAHELLEKTDIRPIIFETTTDIGGIAKTVNYKGNRIDIGGHRFFSKSDRVMDWWQRLLPLQGAPARDALAVDISGPSKPKSMTLAENGPDPEQTDRVMLIRNRVSRIFFLRKFFDYPIALNLNTVANLGPVRIFKIGLSLIRTKLFPVQPERSLQDFLTNRFGRELYRTFFMHYTEKVWGVPCDKISAEWGAQRIKGLSITKAILHAIKFVAKVDSSVSQKSTETTLIQRFLYPKLGPGQLWEYVAEVIRDKGGEIHLGHTIVGLKHQNGTVTEALIRDEAIGQTRSYSADYFFSTMPVKHLIRALGDDVPANVREVSEGLVYRDFVTVGLLLRKLKIKSPSSSHSRNGLIPDNWIYIQETDVRVGRLQVFNNWSPYMVKDPSTVWIGLEYFCDQNDDLWRMKDDDFARLAVDELSQIDIIDKEDALDSVVIRMPNTYPAYFGTYDRFDVIRGLVDRMENLFLIGRNGMHRYNNQDHSMLTAMVAVENIINNVKSKENIWSLNTEQDYHEEREN